MYVTKRQVVKKNTHSQETDTRIVKHENPDRTTMIRIYPMYSLVNLYLSDDNPFEMGKE
jgi:hypothetical protein